MNLAVTHSPHFRTSETTKSVMIDVLIALFPVSLAAIVMFGMNAFLLMLVSTFTAMLTESVLLHFKEGPAAVFKNLFGDGSAAVTGLILAHIVSPLLPLWIMALGSFFAIFLGKYVYGGIGSNIFNPALVGRAILVASFTVQMAAFYNPLDGMIGATSLVTRSAEMMPLFLGTVAGCLGETSFLAILLGAAYLFYKKQISWHIPLTYLAVTTVLSTVAGWSPLYALMSGGLAYGAFFMATDMVTTPITKKGQLIFGLGCGVITFIIRQFGGYPGGVMFSILVMNGFTPIIDMMVKPRLFGGAK